MMVDSEQGQRQEKRDSLFLSATVTIESGKPFSTRVRNLSAGGMMIDVANDPVPGTPVVAELRGIGEIDGRIAWASPGRAGVAFDEDIDPRLARATTSTKIDLPDYLKAPVGRRPGLAIR
ncbi:PilZ domain-containing protein [Sphingomonas sp. SUN039]|uniref:PilZ domain-containing protein n=1 Tax=Sphingomonas sp. SUN039 TaxID=2937787 RepID=UPI002164C4DE|nr:PilZ domain-containing protein [Sphingomonas sp. SUN039]UVO53442.1 PilZ domain-containing protein [Sphingomonas sp. SUN039]